MPRRHGMSGVSLRQVAAASFCLIGQGVSLTRRHGQMQRLLMHDMVKKIARGFFQMILARASHSGLARHAKGISHRATHAGILVGRAPSHWSTRQEKDKTSPTISRPATPCPAISSPTSPYAATRKVTRRDYRRLLSRHGTPAYAKWLAVIV